MPDPLRAFLNRPNDDPFKAAGVAGVTALVCALVVSTAAILLEPYQAAHVAREREARMAAMLDTLPGLRALMVEAGVTGLTTRLVDLRNGSYAEGDPAAFDYAAARGAEDAIDLSAEDDIAGLGRIPARMPVHLLEREGDIAVVVLPVRGTGYAAGIEALLALDSSLGTIAGLTILAQGDTPGLGARIADPPFQNQWPGTEIRDESGTLAVSVVRDGADRPWEVDGITGATRTSNGVQQMLRFWLGPEGYGPFLERLRP